MKANELPINNFLHVYLINKGLTETLEYDIDIRTIKRELTRIYNVA